MKKVIGEFSHNYVALHEAWGCERAKGKNIKDYVKDTYMLNSVVKM